MKMRALIALCLSVSLLSILCVNATAAKAKKPAAKPKTAKKTPVTTTKPHVVKGTKQWNGENAGLNETFTLDNNINFTLKSLEYSPGPFCVGDDTTIPSGPDKKYLILHFTLHNPMPQEISANWASVYFTVVDDKDVNNESNQYIGVETDKSKLSTNLKPGQKVECYSAVLLPNEAKPAKIIVRGNEPEKGVLRYYKEKFKISPMQPPYADPKDPTGATALASIPGQIGTFYTLKYLAYRVDSLAYAGKVKDDTEPEENKRYFVATVTLKNIGVNPWNVGWGEHGGSKIVTDQDEDLKDYEYLLPKAGRTSDYMELAPDKERIVRFCFPISNDSTAKTLVLCCGDDSRTLTLDVSNVK